MQEYKGSLTGAALREHISTFPGRAHVKDATTFKYTLTNQKNLDAFGLKRAEDLIGLTLNELSQHMRPYWDKSYPSIMEEYDLKVKNTGLIHWIPQQQFIDKKGTLHQQCISKIPIFSEDNSVAAILTTGTNVIENFTKLELLNRYKNFYKTKREACAGFMTHFKLSDFFITALTEKELITLCLMVEDCTYKYLASKMNVSLKTIETHVSNMKNKLYVGRLADVLLHLRTVAN